MVPYRQFVLSLPVLMRHWLDTNKKFFARLHRLVVDAVRGYYADNAAMLGIKALTPL
jgi:hypothetical protein